MDANDNSEPEIKKPALVADYIRDGRHWDTIVSAWLTSHFLPLPPPLVRKIRFGIGRLIDGGFNVGVGWLDCVALKQKFNLEQQLETVRQLANVGRPQLIENNPLLPEAVARSFLSEHKLKFDNRVSVAQKALDDLARDPGGVDGDQDELNVDWLNHFSDIAGKKSAPEMQELLGRILAGEIRRPGSFSPMCISVLANLTPLVAKKFEALCSVSCKIYGANYILGDIFPKFSSDGIPELNFTYADFLLLRQYQLLAIENGTVFNIPVGVSQHLALGESQYLITPLIADVHQTVAAVRRLTASPFSVIGDELRPLLRPAAPPWLPTKISDTYKAPAWALQRINIDSPATPDRG